MEEASIVRCNIATCGEEADVEVVIHSASGELYTYHFCEKHEKQGTELFTDRISKTQKKVPVRWVRNDTPSREKQERLKKDKEEWEKRQAEYRQKNFYSYGYADYVCGRESKYTHTSKADKLALTSGRKAAQADEEKYGRIVLILQYLLNIMEDAIGNEWYGSDFDKPIMLLKEAMKEAINFSKKE